MNHINLQQKRNLKKMKLLKFDFNKRLRKHRYCLTTCIYNQIAKLDYEKIIEYKSIDKEIEKHCRLCNFNKSDISIL